MKKLTLLLVCLTFFTAAILYSSTLSAKNPRSKFKADENTVSINLDHPYISDLKKGDASKDITKNLFFTKISHEIAYTEYAMGLVNLLHSKQYYGEDTADYLREVRDIINTLSTPS